MVPLAVRVHGADMRTPRGKVDNKFLVHPKGDAHAALDQQGDMGIGTEPPVRDQHVARLQGRMEGDHLGHIKGTQGSRSYFQHHAGAGMKQRQLMGRILLKLFDHLGNGYRHR